MTELPTSAFFSPVALPRRRGRGHCTCHCRRSTFRSWRARGARARRLPRRSTLRTSDCCWRSGSRRSHVLRLGRLVDVEPLDPTGDDARAHEPHRRQPPKSVTRAPARSSPRGRPTAQSLLRQVGGDRRWGDVLAVPLRPCGAVPRVPRWRDGGRRRLLVREPDDRPSAWSAMRLEAWRALVHTAAGVEPGPDAQPGGHRRRHRPREHRALGRTGAAPAHGGAEAVCNSTAGSFADDLIAAIAATGATIAARSAVDVSPEQILSCMEAALLARRRSTAGTARRRTSRSTCTETSTKGLVLDRVRHGLGHRRVALVPYLARAGGEEIERMRQRVAAGVRTTFAGGTTVRSRSSSRHCARRRHGVRPAGHGGEVPHHAERVTWAGVTVPMRPGGDDR